MTRSRRKALCDARATGRALTATPPPTIPCWPVASRAAVRSGSKPPSAAAGSTPPPPDHPAWRNPNHRTHLKEPQMQEKPPPLAPIDPSAPYALRMMLIRRYWYLTLGFSHPFISDSRHWEASWNGGQVEAITEAEMLAKALEALEDCGATVTCGRRSARSATPLIVTTCCSRSAVSAFSAITKSERSPSTTRTPPSSKAPDRREARTGGPSLPCLFPPTGLHCGCRPGGMAPSVATP
jgi:hypothetical protein